MNPTTMRDRVALVLFLVVAIVATALVVGALA
jgi:hypothetical protein